MPSARTSRRMRTSEVVCARLRSGRRIKLSSRADVNAMRTTVALAMTPAWSTRPAGTLFSEVRVVTAARERAVQ